MAKEDFSPDLLPLCMLESWFVVETEDILQEVQSSAGQRNI